MAADKITIKYLFEIYPATDFSEDFVFNQYVQRLPNTAEIIQTDEKHGDIRDGIVRSRKIQTTVFQNYEVKIQTSRQIDWPRLNYAEYTQMTDSDDNVFLIYDVVIDQQKVQGSLTYVINISFKKAEHDIIYHLSSDNVYDYKTDLTETVNEIQFSVDNAAFSFNNVNVYADATISPGADIPAFKVPVNELTDQISVGDAFYLHTDDEAFNLEKDGIGQYLSACEVYDKDTDYVYFICSDDEVAGTFDYTIPNLIIDNEPDWRDIPSGITPAGVTVSGIIYTFIEPKFDHTSEDVDGVNAPDGVEEIQKGYERDILTLKAWLRTSDLWKAEYLRYSKNEDVLISLDNYTNIIPSQIKDIIAKKDNNNLIDIYEFDIKVIYNVKSINWNR